jgi:hypothetical protein
MANNARNEASIPNSALAPFGVLVGTWATVGTHPLIPSTTVMATPLSSGSKGERFWRFTGTLVDAVAPLLEKGSVSRDGTTWEKDLELTYTRVD